MEYDPFRLNLSVAAERSLSLGAAVGLSVRVPVSPLVPVPQMEFSQMDSK